MHFCDALLLDVFFSEHPSEEFLERGFVEGFEHEGRVVYVEAYVVVGGAGFVCACGYFDFAGE